MLDRMNRRQFFRVAAGAAAAAVVAPEFVKAEGQKFFQLDRTMLTPVDPRFPRKLTLGDYPELLYNYPQRFDYAMIYDNNPLNQELIWCTGFDESGAPQWVRGGGGDGWRRAAAEANRDLEIQIIANKRDEFTWRAVVDEEAYVGGELAELRGHDARGVPDRAGANRVANDRRSRRHLFSREGLLALVSGDGLARDEVREPVDG